MKIAVIGSRGIPANYSGIERAVEEVSSRLVARGHDISVYCRLEGGAGHEYKGVKLIKVTTLRSKNFGTLIHVFFSTISVLFKKVDIVHYHALGPSVFSFLPRIFGKKTIVTIHSFDWQRKKWGALARLFLKLSLYSSIYFPNRTVVVSNRLKDYLEERFKKLLYFIPNGACHALHNEFWQLRGSVFQRNKYILFVGRLVPEKNIHFLIEAFNQLNTDFKLLLAGESSFTDNYVRHLKDISGPGVQFLGFVEGQELEALYKNAYLVVLPSEIEGAPLSLLEAMSYGVCVLSSNLPGCEEIIGESGFYFKTNDLQDLKKQLQYLLSNPALVHEFSQKAKERVNKFYDWDKIADSTEKLYLSLKK